MGDIWLLDGPTALRDHGCQVIEYPGWQIRSRSSGGYEQVLAYGTHHDAWPTHVPWQRRAQYAWEQASARPIGAMITNFDGTIIWGAAGATNTQGRSEHPIRMSRGTIPTSRGNLYVVANEIMCDGIGTPFTEDQCEAVERSAAAIVELCNLSPLDVLSHHRYTARKIDPRGHATGRPSWATGYSEWNDIAVGESVAARLASREFDMKFIDTGRQRLVDTRPEADAITNLDGRPLDGEVRVPKHPDVPASATAAFITITVVAPTATGHVRVWADGPITPASVLNFDGSSFEPGGSIANSTPVELAGDGRFNLYTSKPVNIIVDVTAYV
jgi:hypothetical protein